MMGKLPYFLLLALFLRCSQQSTTTWPESIVRNVPEVKDHDFRQQFEQLQSTDSELSSNMGFVAASTPSLDSIYSKTGIVLCWKLLLRSLYLLFLYLPTLLLSPFAYFSVNFREAIWFPLLRASIASSGAVLTVRCQSILI